jgi:hypothetical protein
MTAEAQRSAVPDDEVAYFEAGVPAEVGVPLSGPARWWAAVLWPSFLMAGVLEALVFSLVDPGELHWLGGAAVEANHRAVYTVAFFVFWVVIALASGLTQWVLVEPNTLDRPYRNHL